MDTATHSFQKKITIAFLSIFMVLGCSLFAVMMVYANKKIIIVNDFENAEAETAETLNTSSQNLKWLVKTDSTSDKEGFYIPVNTHDFTVDTDFPNHSFSISIPATRETYFTANKPYGNFDRVTQAEASFDGESVTYVFSTDGVFSIEASYKDNTVFVLPDSIYEEDVVIAIDPGHGGVSAGNMAGEYSEKDIALKVAKAVEKKAAGKSYKVILTRGADRNPGTDVRIETCEVAGADYYVGIHVDADPEDTKKFGMYAVYNDEFFRNSLENVDLADSILKNCAIATNNRAIGLNKADSSDVILKVLSIPAINLNVGYISNPSESELLGDAGYIDKIADGILNTFDNIIAQ